MDNIEFWEILKEYPDFAISDLGRIKKISTDRIYPESKSVQIRYNNKRIMIYVKHYLQKYFHNNEDEIWKEIIDFPSFCISNFGRIRKNNLKIFTPSPKRNGYIEVSLTNEKCQKSFSVHRLVALYFIPNLDNKTMVNHKNGIKTDNKVENLEWVTPSENRKHAHDNNLIKYMKIPVKCLNENDELIKEYGSAREAIKDGFSYKAISACVNGRQNYHKGYKWIRSEEKKEDEEIINEKWIPTKDSFYADIDKFNYYVSDFGRIKNKDGKILHNCKSQGVESITLYNKGVKKHFLIHRLILMAFNIYNPGDKPEVDHIDSNPLNNRLDNLKWATGKENSNNPISKQKRLDNTKNR